MLIRWVSSIKLAGNTNNRYYFYDEAGHLLGEYLANGTRVQEYVWMDDQLVAVLSDHDASTYQFVETDHLGTPRAVIHPVENNIVWRWNLTNTAFGEHAASNNPDGDAVTFTFNLRYPGQQYDAESTLHYNYFRDYEAATGRYVESDPIGLGGGASTYSYVGNNSILNSDIFGLYANCKRYEYSNDGIFTVKRQNTIWEYSYTSYAPLPQGMPTGLDADFRTWRGRGILIPDLSFDWKLFRITHFAVKGQTIAQDMIKRHYLVVCEYECGTETVNHLRFSEKIGSEYVIDEWYRNYFKITDMGAPSVPIPRD